MDLGMDVNYYIRNNSSFPLEKHVVVRTVVITVSCLTMIGSVFVVLSYLCLKSFRSEARQIVCNISIMDFGIGLANFTGAVVNFDSFYQHKYNNDTLTYDTIVTNPIMDPLCKAQAFVALLTTLSSVFWTMSLAVYMYIMVFHNYQRAILLYLPFCYVICYGLPIALCIWLLLTHRLGNAPYNSSGWCGIILVRPDDGSIDRLGAIIGYDLWIYLTLFLCVTMYSALFLRMNVEFRSAARFVSFQKFWKQALHFLDYKLLLIPIAFFILRIWTCIVNILFVYCAIRPDSFPHSLNMALVILAGIGDSGQGFANGLIFVFLVKNIRSSMLSLEWIKRCRRRQFMKISVGPNTPLLINSDNAEDRMFTPTNSLTKSSGSYQL